MPELAEVFIMTKNLRDGLKDSLIDLKVSDLFMKKANITDLKLPKRISSINSKGKMTYFIFDDMTVLELHYGMTGNIRDTDDKHCHITFITEDVSDSLIKRSILYYHDIRRFGSLTYHSNATKFHKKLQSLGLDPLQTDLSDISVIGLLIQKFRNRNNMNICKVLMSQEVISGIGNYMKAEILYALHIHPLANVSHLSDELLLQIFKQAIYIAKSAVLMGGASLYSYTGLDGSKSEFKSYLKVYNREKDPNGYTVQIIRDKDSPDKRTTHYVSIVQVIGQPIVVPVIKLKNPITCKNPQLMQSIQSKESYLTLDNIKKLPIKITLKTKI